MKNENLNSIEIDKERFEQWIVLTARDWRDLTPIMPVSGIPVLDWDRRSLLRCAFEARRFIVRESGSLAAMANNPMLHQKLNNVVSYYQNYCQRESEIFLRLGLGTVLSMYDINHNLERLERLCHDLQAGHFVSESILHETLIHMFIRHFKIRTPKEIKEKVMKYLSQNPVIGDIVLIQPITGTPWIDHALHAATQALIKVLDSAKDCRQGLFSQSNPFRRSLRYFESLLAEEEKFSSLFPEVKMKMHHKDHQKIKAKLNDLAAKEAGAVDLSEWCSDIIITWLDHLYQKDSRDYAFYMVADVIRSNETLDLPAMEEQLLFYFCRSSEDVDRKPIFQHILKLKPLDLERYDYDKRYISEYMRELYRLVHVYDRNCLDILTRQWKTVYCPQLVENASFLQTVQDYRFYADKGALVYDSLLADRLLKGWIMNTNVIGKVPNPMRSGEV